MRFRRSRTTRSQTDLGKAGFDTHTWERVVGLVTAATEADARAYARAFQAAATLPVPLLRRVEFYVRRIFWYQAADMGIADSDEALVLLAQRVTPDANRVAVGTWTMYLEALRQALNRGRDDPELKAIQVDMLCAAAVGTILAEAGWCVEDYRPRLEAFFNTHAGFYRELETSS